MAAWLAPRLPATRGAQAGRADAAGHLLPPVADILPPGVLNVVTGFGLEAGKPLASSKRIAKIAFTGETTTGASSCSTRRRTSSR